jgi:hypothetical protein
MYTHPEIGSLMGSVRSQAEEGMNMGSSKKQGSKVLGVITAAEAERLLVDWVNLKQEDAKKFLERYGGLLGNVFNSNEVFSLQGELREAWVAPNSRDRSWYLFMIRHTYAFAMKCQALGRSRDELLTPQTPEERIVLRKMLAAPPEISPLEAALYYLQEAIGDRAKRCGYEGCRNPYFVAEKRWQKYCSEKCATPSNQKAKRKWWHEHKGKGLL